MGRKMEFVQRSVKRNRNEIEAQKSDFELPTKRKTIIKKKQKKEHDRQ